MAMIVELPPIQRLQASTDQTDSAPFIEFILQMIFDAIQNSSTTDQVTVQDGDHVQRLVSVMGQKEYSLTELMTLRFVSSSDISTELP